jgi:hypothetical protein
MRAASSGWMGKLDSMYCPEFSFCGYTICGALSLGGC